MIGVKVTQELFRKVEKRVAERQMDAVSQLVRFLLPEECMRVELDAADRKLIASRKKAKKEGSR